MLIFFRFSIPKQVISNMKIQILFDQLIQNAIDNKVTDIHFDVTHNIITFRRYKLHITSYHENETLNLYNYLRYKSNLTNESFTTPQTGSFSYNINDVTYSLRFASLETTQRKHAVLRILNIVPINRLEDCKIDEKNIIKIRRLFTLKNGLLLFCGKTGSGKTTTLFTALNELENKQIFTLENPIERYYPHLIQLEYNNNALGISITQLLRHDPDILVIGEIRTEEELAETLRAAYSGHFVVSTIHSGSEVELLHRIKDLNKRQASFDTILKGIVFQEVIEESFYFRVYEECDLNEL